MESIRVLIADDEPLARRRLSRLLAGETEIEIVGEADSGRDTVAAIRSLAPDLVFLDVQMPELDGFGVVSEIGPEAMPTVVFVTAFDEYALRAFEASALDYLLKPFDDRFAHVLQRAREAIRRDRLEDLCGRLRSLLDGDRPPPASEEASRECQDRLVIRSAGRVMLIEAEEVDWIEGAGSYVRLHVGARSYLLRQTLRHLETRLDAECFVRIHRSTIVNRQRVR
ncbi:MAG: LytTR family DNA-binding domain-containing protein [Acidobacteriota bacterium]